MLAVIDENLLREERSERRKRAFFRARVAVLLAILFAVCVYALDDFMRRHRRNDWKRPLRVGLVLVRRGPVDARAMEALVERVPALEDQLAREYARHRGADMHPVRLVMRGPVEEAAAPPQPGGDGLLDAARFGWALRGYRRRIGAKIVDPGADSVIYLVLRPGGRVVNFLEGISQQGGRVGLVEAQLDTGMADFALFAAAHELFHTLGASDKYDAGGDVLVPSGLAEPERVPQYPQRYTELMARHRPLGPGRSVPPERIEELRVGPETAREIGWLAK